MNILDIAKNMSVESHRDYLRLRTVANVTYNGVTVDVGDFITMLYSDNIGNAFMHYMHIDIDQNDIAYVGMAVNDYEKSFTHKIQCFLHASHELHSKIQFLKLLEELKLLDKFIQFFK